MADVDAVWSALADPTRREVVDVLRRGPLRAGELASTVGVSGPALSRHLRVLRESGVVAVEFAENDARGRRYSLREEPFVALQAWLDQIHAFWGEQLAGFAEHVRAETARSTGSAQGSGSAPKRAARRGSRSTGSQSTGTRSTGSRSTGGRSTGSPSTRRRERS